LISGVETNMRGDKKRQVYGFRIGDDLLPILLTYREYQTAAIRGICREQTSGQISTFVSSHVERKKAARSYIDDLFESWADEVEPGSTGIDDEHLLEVYAEEEDSTVVLDSSKILKPKDLVAFLDQYVVGQDRAKRVLSVAISNFCARRLSGSPLIPKSNVLLVGPTGVGKTYMVELLAKELDIPLYMTKLTGKSSTGYVGENLMDIFQQIRIAHPEEDAPHALVFLDEVDKIAKDAWSGGSGFGRRIMQELVGWIESATIGGLVGENRQPLTPISTENMTFIFAGAFMGDGSGETLVDIIAKRLKLGQKAIGFRTDEQKVDDAKPDETDLLVHLSQDDLQQYGLMYEFVGRIPYIGTLSSLSNEDILTILKTKKRSVLTKYRALLKVRGFDLTISDEALSLIAERANPRFGARGLQTVFGDFFTDILYEPEVYAKDGVIAVDPTLVEQELHLH